MKSQKKKNSQEKSHSEVGVRIRHSCAIDKLRAINGKLTEDQRKLIEKTPFHVLLDIPSIKINGYLLSSLIEGWDEDANGFRFKGTLVRFTSHDVACILGLRVGGKVVGVLDEHGSSQVHDLLSASFPNPNKSLDRTHVQNLLPNCASPEDFVRVYIASAFTSFLFPLPSKGIHGNFFRLLDNLDQVGDYGWGKAVYDFLLVGIRHAVKARKEKKNFSEIYIQGCVPLLQLWALEHTGMVQDSTSLSLWPRIRKWTSKNLTNKDAHATIHVTEDSKEVVAVLVPTKQESNEPVVMESIRMVDSIDDYSPRTTLPSGHGHVMELRQNKRKYEEMEKSASPPDVDPECYGDERDAFADALSYMSPEDPSVAFLGETSQKRHSESNVAKCIKIQPHTHVPGRQVCIPFQAINLKGCSSAVLRPLDEPNAEIEVTEEVELAVQKHSTSIRRNCGKEIHPSESRSLQLQFINNFSLLVFTGARIEGEECSNVKVALIDGLTGQIVHFGPESSAKVEIVVLEGDFDGDEGGNWTLEDFKNNIVREREGKKPLLTGDVFLNLKEGVGLVGEISFTDNSCWTRSRKFRLGARVVDNSDGTRIREAKTESFVVRDHHGELYRKHHPPSLFDEVWRLENIGKDGAFHKRLSWENINTVKDFLILLFIDLPRLRNILGTGMSAKMWEVTVAHARTCVLDKRVYLYCPPGSSQKTGVAFNDVGQVMGLCSGCQYVPIDMLSETEKAAAHNLVISAFEHWGEVVSFDDEISLMGGSLYLTDVLYPSNSPRMESSPDIISSIYSIGGFDNTQPTDSSSDIISLDDFVDNMGLRYGQPFTSLGQVTNMICDTESITEAFCDDDGQQFFDTDCFLQSPDPSLESQADLDSVVSAFVLARSAADAIAQRRWTKISSVMKWLTIRRIVALMKT